MTKLPNHRLLPQDPRYPRGFAKIRATRLYAEAKASGDERALAAAGGRLAYFQGLVPQRDASGPAAVAWRRESGADPGFMNRTHRRQLGLTITATTSNVVAEEMKP